MLKVLRHDVIIKSGLMTNQHLQVGAHEIPILRAIHKGQVEDKGPCSPPVVFGMAGVAEEYERMCRRYGGNTESENGTKWVDEAYGNPLALAFENIIKANLVKDAGPIKYDGDPESLADLKRPQLLKMVKALKIKISNITKNNELKFIIMKAHDVSAMGGTWPDGLPWADFLDAEADHQETSQAM